MSDIDITELALTAIVTYGSFGFGLALMLGALGVPLPGTLLVLAVGAFVRDGVMDMWTALAVGMAGVVLGDSLSYAMGRFGTQSVKHHFSESHTWEQAQQTFDKYGGLAVYATRCVLTPLAVPTNLIAGGSYPFWRFLLYDAAGEFTWLLIYGLVGYWFGSQWEEIAQIVSDFSGVLVGVVLIGGGLYYIWRRQHHTEPVIKR